MDRAAASVVCRFTSRNSATRCAGKKADNAMKTQCYDESTDYDMVQKLQKSRKQFDPTISLQAISPVFPKMIGYAFAVFLAGIGPEAPDLDKKTRMADIRS